MLAEYGTMSLKEVLGPAMQLAEGYPIEAQTANLIERSFNLPNLKTIARIENHITSPLSR